MNTLMRTEQPGYHMSCAVAPSAAARVAGEKSARDRRGLAWAFERVQLIEAEPTALTVVPTHDVAPSAQERST